MATISAQGKAEFAGGVGVASQNYQLNEIELASNSANLAITTDKTAGKAVLPAGQTTLVIQSNKVNNQSLIYVTPMGSTNNQVLYISNQQAYQPANNITHTPDVIGSFSIKLDQALDHDLEFNWWMVN